MDRNQAAERAWELWETGETEALVRWLERCDRRGLGDPTGGVLSALLALESQDFPGAQRWLACAQAALPCDDFGLLLAQAEIDLSLWRLEAAQAGFAALLEQGPDAGLWLRYSLCADLLGDLHEGERAVRAAIDLDPEGCGRLPWLDPEEFTALVGRAAGRLAPEFARALERWPVLIDPVPSRLLARERPLETPPDALGLFVGHSDLERSADGQGAAPPAIYLFQRNLQRFCADAEMLEQEVATTLYHELGHALGFDEAGLTELGLE
jgi:predicted Zn-dependent protease with MMP-like domain